MPRPKRSKVASATTRVATTSRVAKTAPRQPQPQPQPQTGPDPIERFSDDSDGLVVKSTRPRRRMPWQPEPQRDADVTMTGALPVEEEVPGANGVSSKARTPSSNVSNRTRTIRGSAKLSSKTTSPVALRSPTKVAEDAPAQDMDSSEFGDNLLSFTSLGSESPAHGTRPPSAIKVGATPAHETSILALTNFKRRARQPSLLRMVHQTTDVEDNDLSDPEEIDDFLPDDESTPLHVHKSAPDTEAVNNISGISLSSSESRGRKRKLSSPVVQVPRSSPPYEPVSGEDRKKRGVPERNGESDGVEEGKADRPAKPKAKRKPKANQGISTAKLQALLPRRRTRAVAQERDEYDLDNSEDMIAVDSDQDELQLPTRRQTTTRKPAPSKTTQKSSRGPKKPVTGAQSAQKSTRTYGRRISSDKENEATFVAGEESEDAEETTETAIAAPAPKLVAIAKKFEDVDAWEMEFESVDADGQTSSPWR
ncbi:hypothetical protein BDV95DRAFT_481894 [Massariosphaeria phaeospora]|uniref:Uncharacterized protein n=1 Tax=Massariosphaeria phaeospora TaxID=100035 RepID=A0A7C8IHQ4_9PLEO|nr:hypothetical protein BDV95DRAFT_481894 [Massariosphaeria phaeospora]